MCSSILFGRSVIPLVDKSLSTTNILAQKLVTLCTNEFKYSSRLVSTLSYYQMEVQLPTCPRQDDINDIGKRYRTSTDDSSESYETLLFHHAWLVSFE
jgi:hypothetical protein